MRWEHLWILHLNCFCAFGDRRWENINCWLCEFGTIWKEVYAVVTFTLSRTILDIISFQESHNSRRKREIAEKQIDDSGKFSLFAERKYQTLVSIFQQPWILGRRWQDAPYCWILTTTLFSPELQHERELREHKLPAARAGQQGLCRSALEVMEQHVSRGSALPRGCPWKSIRYLLGPFSLPKHIC